MKRLVIDTNILIDFQKGYAVWLQEILKSPGIEKRVVLPTIAIAEYLTAQSFDKKQTRATGDKVLSMFVKQDFTEGVARVMGELLRHKDYPSGASIQDLIIASTAVYLDLPLATGNKKHFEGIPDLRFFDPKSIES